MVDLVMKNQFLDTTFMFAQWMDLYPAIPSNCIRDKLSFASQWAAIEQTLPKKLEDLYSLYQ